MALIGDLVTTQSRVNIRSAISLTAVDIGRRLGLTEQETSMVATRLIQCVEDVTVEPSGHTDGNGKWVSGEDG